MQEKLYYTWEYIHRLTLNLADEILSRSYDIDYIAAVSRGGLIPGVLMSHYMDLPIVPIQWSTRDFGEQVHYGDVVEDIQAGKTILLVDDINDSGKTFIDILKDWEYTTECKGKVITASVFQRTSTTLPSDHHSKLITSQDWLVFPWEKK